MPTGSGGNIIVLIDVPLSGTPTLIHQLRLGEKARVLNAWPNPTAGGTVKIGFGKVPIASFAEKDIVYVGHAGLGFGSPLAGKGALRFSEAGDGVFITGPAASAAWGAVQLEISKADFVPDQE